MVKVGARRGVGVGVRLLWCVGSRKCLINFFILSVKNSASISSRAEGYS